VFCNGEEVLTVSGTKKEYVVDVWSGNHPFYLVRVHAALPHAAHVARSHVHCQRLLDLTRAECSATRLPPCCARDRSG
jgi:hypothetical protein